MTRPILLTLVLASLAACALSDEPGSGTKSLPQGLSVLKATDTSVSLAYRKADTVIYLSALIGQATPEPYQATPGSPKFEVDARFDADSGRTFYSRRGGDQWLDPSWPGDSARQGDLPLTRESNAALFGLAAEATAALEREAATLLGADRSRKLDPALQALREFGSQAVEIFAAERANLEGYLVGSGATAEEIRQDEVAYGTSGPEDSGPYLMGDGYYYIAVHDKGIYWDFGYHSATRLYQWYGYWAAIHDACNHGDCAGTMGQKCTLDYYASPVGWKPAWTLQNCATGYDWDSEDGGHNCHDDTRLQMSNFVYGSYNDGQQGWCNDGDSDTDISVDIWGVELDQDGSPECNGSTNKGYNHPSWSPNAAPIGNVDGVDGASHTVWGWAYDRNQSSTEIAVHFYVDGPVGQGQFAGSAVASGSRPDVNAAFGISGNHGFGFALPSPYWAGTHTVYVYAIDTWGGNNPLIGTKTFSNAAPTGYLDGVSTASHTAWGWTYDPDTSADIVAVHFYLDGPAGQGTMIGAVTTAVSRPDVNSAFGITGVHGFNFTIPPQYRSGTHTLYAYAIDSWGGHNPLLNQAPKTFAY